MLLTTRMIKFAVATVPPIKRVENPNIKGFEDFSNKLVQAMMDKLSTYHKEENIEKYDFMRKCQNREKEMFTDCVNQTISFLKSIRALKGDSVTILDNKFELWKNAYQMSPFYEGINAELHSAMVEYHYPRIAEELAKGRCYSHWGLTQIKEAVLYTMEFFQKSNCFLPAEEVVTHPEVIKWVDEHAIWCSEHKEELAKKTELLKKGREETEKEMQDIEKRIDEIKKVRIV